MKWVNDRTGRFGKRPHFELDELDVACERIMSDFLRRHRGQVRYPISLDDLTVLVEAMTTSLDLYADLTADGADVEGVTDFRLGKRPEVSVAAVLAEDERRVNRLKTTLTHELGHVHSRHPFPGPDVVG